MMFVPSQNSPSSVPKIIFQPQMIALIFRKELKYHQHGKTLMPKGFWENEITRKLTWRASLPNKLFSLVLYQMTLIHECYFMIFKLITIIIIGLKKYTKYKMRVAASTHVGESSLSEENDIFVRTLEDGKNIRCNFNQKKQVVLHAHCCLPHAPFSG